MIYLKLFESFGYREIRFEEIDNWETSRIREPITSREMKLLKGEIEKSGKEVEFIYTDESTIDLIIKNDIDLSENESGISVHICKYEDDYFMLSLISVYKSNDSKDWDSHPMDSSTDYICDEIDGVISALKNTFNI